MEDTFGFIFCSFICFVWSIPIIFALIVYKDAQRSFDPNAIVWAVLTFSLPIPMIFIYFAFKNRMAPGSPTSLPKQQNINNKRPVKKSGPIERY